MNLGCFTEEFLRTTTAKVYLLTEEQAKNIQITGDPTYSADVATNSEFENSLLTNRQQPRSLRLVSENHSSKEQLATLFYDSDKTSGQEDEISGQEDETASVASPQSQERQVRITEEQQELVNLFNTLDSAGQRAVLAAARHAAKLPTEQRLALASTFERLAAPEYSPPPLPPVDSGYKKLPPRTQASSADLIAFTRAVWGTWLKCENKHLAQDAMTRQDLKDRDPLLFSRLTKQLSTPELERLISKSKRGPTPVDGPVTDEEIKKAHRILRRAYRQKHPSEQMTIEQLLSL